MNLSRALLVLVFSLGVPLLASAQEVKVSSVKLQVRDGDAWVPTSGRLFRLVDGARSQGIDVGEDGKPDIEVTCKPGDRFEADAISPLDRPSHPPRIRCGQSLTFKYVRAVYAEWSGVFATPGTTAAISPKLYSELKIRSSKVAPTNVTAAFNDAAIAATANLLGDVKLDQYVVRDPAQDYKLVFNEAGVEALKAKQRQGGLRETGMLDAATQALFASEAPWDSGPHRVTPSISCSQPFGQMVCSNEPNSTKANMAVTVPPFELRSQPR
ncbi:MAG: hypothetical protein ACO1PB_17750 [Ramlibacter sp.]